MTFEDYWKALITKNPKLEEDVVKVKKTGLYNMLKQAYDKGYDHSTQISAKINQALRGAEQHKNPDASDFFNFFGQMGGK